jgi:Sigma-70, region 4
MRSRIDLDRYRELFSDPESTFASIGQRMNVSRERVRQIYEVYFKSKLGPRIERSVLRKNRSRRKLIEEAASADGISDAKRLVWTLAANAGLHVTRLVSSTGNILRATMTLVINGHICEVSYARATLRTARRAVARYTAHKWSHGTIEFLVCVRKMDAEPEVFIIPSHELTKHKSGRISIPVQRSERYKNHFARIDFWKYQNAWDLLR